MRYLPALLLLVSCLTFAQSTSAPAPYDAVDPFIGTAEGGNTFPGATLPFGMIQWGPDTQADGWYHYPDKTIRGFSLTHISGAGCSIYADVPILPLTGELTRVPDASFADVFTFSHDHEQAHPGYYAVEANNGIKTELTVTARAGIGRFSFPADALRTLIFEAGNSATIPDEKRKGDTSAVEIRGNNTLVGSVHSGGFCGSNTNYTLYFVAKFSKPFASFGTWTDALKPGTKSASGHKAGAWVSFSRGGAPIVVKVSVSFVSIENAAANLKAEVPGWDFDAVKTAATARWTRMLQKIEVDGGTHDERTNFYTGLYHMLLSPNLFSDVNGDYIGFDSKVRRLKPGEAQYANYSDWDIYRNVVQLQSLLLPAESSQMAQSLVRDAEQSGWLPRWPVANDVSYVMGGDSSAILISTAYAFGARKFDTASALRSMVKGATVVGKGPHDQELRPWLGDYLAKGYIPVVVGGNNEEQTASIVLEYNSADFAISRFAEAMGDHDNAARLLRQSQTWRTLFDPESGFIRPRTTDGKFVQGWNPDRLEPHKTNWDKDNQLGFEEGSTWQYTWMIPHNYAGLLRAMGGAENALPKLDKFFEKLTGWAGPTFTVTNEPDFCAPYVYVWTGNAWKTQQIIDRIRRETFKPKPEGLPGNDDLGATSGVYVWNALGMYPVIPGVGGMVIGTPMFPRAVVKSGNGKTLEITASGKGIFVHSAKLNGKNHASTWIPLASLSAPRNKLEFVMSEQPDKAWGSQPENLPPSFDVPEK